MTKTHWKKAFDKNYLGSHDLDNGKDLVATIDHIEVQKALYFNGFQELNLPQIKLTMHTQLFLDNAVSLFDATVTDVT